MSILGFGALGSLALGQLPQLPPATALQQTAWPSSVKKSGLAIAVIATTAVGFVPPPPAQAAIAFTTFSDAACKIAPKQTGWIASSFVATAPSAVFANFSQPLISRSVLPDEQSSALFEAPPPTAPIQLFSAFAQPLPVRAVLPDEQPSALFEVTPPIGVAFTGFFSFGVPQCIRFSFADQQTSTLFETQFVPIAPQGGGTSRRLDEPEAPSVRNKKTRFNPVKKRTAEPLEVARREPVPLPPFTEPVRLELPDSYPLDLVDRDLIPQDLLGLQQQIFRAQEQHSRDQQDAADIADVLAALDLE